MCQLCLNPLFIRSQIQMFHACTGADRIGKSQSLIHQVSDSDNANGQSFLRRFLSQSLIHQVSDSDLERKSIQLRKELSQSLIHQVSDSDKQKRQIRRLEKCSLNPLFIRSQIQMQLESCLLDQDLCMSQSLIHQVSDSDFS